MSDGASPKGNTRGLPLLRARILQPDRSALPVHRCPGKQPPFVPRERRFEVIERTNYKGEIVAYGQIKEANWGFEINSPEWELIEDEEDAADFARIIPVYPSTDGLYQKTIRRVPA